MKAIVCTDYGPPEVLQLREVEKPTPKAHEILVRVRATTVTATDCIIRGFMVGKKKRSWIIARLVRTDVRGDSIAVGADAVIDYTAEDFTKRGDLYDLIFDAVGRRKAKIPEYRKALTASGQFISVDDGLPKTRPADLLFLTELGEQGKLRTVIDRRYPLDQIVEAHRYVGMGHKKGNVVITVDRAGS